MMCLEHDAGTYCVTNLWRQAERSLIQIMMWSLAQSQCVRLIPRV